MSSQSHRLAAIAVLLAALAGCASKGGEGSRPVADAGSDVSAYRGEVVTLHGSGSAPGADGPLTFRWRQTAGPAVALSGDRTDTTVFQAPRATGALRFTLAVTSSAHRTAEDEVEVTVLNRAPRADPGPGRAVALGEVVSLDASASTDPDGDPLTATWYQRSGAPVTLTPHAGGATTFVAPSQPATLTFGLVVSDGEATSSEVVVQIQVLDPSANWPPVAHAGADLVVGRRAAVTLYGSGEDREGDPLTFTWTQTAGPTVTLSGASGPSPSFQAPAEEADLEFQLVVADRLTSASDRVVVLVRNQPPTISSVTLSPEAPITTDPLVARAEAFDPDGDLLTVSFAWRRNGAPLDGRTGPTLDPSLTTRGDLIAVTVTVSDGLRSVVGQAAVTIRDAPPVMSVTAPATATWGQPYAFTVALVDPDGDPVGGAGATPELRYGPAGMTVSTSGEGRWTPTLPMFGPELAVHFAVGIAGDGGPVQDQVVRVIDAARADPLRRAGIDIPVWQNGLVAADLHGDGKTELLVASRSGLYELARVAGGYGVTWAYPFALAGPGLTAIAVHDLDGDGKPEIFVASADSWGSAPGQLVVLDGATRRERARAAVACLDVAVADLDRDGAAEVACLTVGGGYDALRTVKVLDAATLATEWETAPFALGADLAIGNVDGDAALEIVTAGGYVFDGATHANEWAYGGGFGRAVAVGDLDGDGVDEIVGMDDWSRFRGFSAVLKSPLWEQTTFDNDALLVADVDGDGVPEIVVGDGQWGNVTAWRYRRATNDLTVVFQVDSQDHGVTSLAVGDLDGDGERELAWGTGATSSGADVLVISGIRATDPIEWKTADPSQLDGPFLGARAVRTVAGAAPALLFEVPRTNSGYSGARLARLDPATGAVALSTEIGTNWSRVGALDAFDADGDGVDEAYLATASLYDGYVAGWDFAAGAAEWTSPLGTGDVRALTHADLNGDGVPDLVLMTATGYVEALDVKGSAVLWKSTAIGAGVDVEVADLDGDGTREIVALAADRLVVFRKATTGPAPWLEAGSVAVQGLDLAVADCDGDGKPEIYVLTGTPYGSGNQSVLRFDATPTQLASLPLQGGATSLALEALGASRQNLLVARSDASPTSSSGSTARLEAIDPRSGAVIWSSPAFPGTVPPNSLGFHDLDGSGRRRIAFGTTSGMFVTR